MNIIKQGMIIKNKRGQYIVERIEGGYITIEQIIRDRKGIIYRTGKKIIIGVNDIDNYSLV